MFVSILLLRAAFQRNSVRHLYYQRKHPIKGPHSGSYRRPISLLMHTDSHPIDDEDESDVEDQQQEPLSEHSNPRVANIYVYGECGVNGATSTANSEKDAGASFFKCVDNEDGINQSQLNHDDEQAECLPFSGICRQGKYVPRACDEFERIHQLDMAVNALLRSHTPPRTYTYISILQDCSKCKGFTQARRVHAYMVSQGVILNSFLSDYLIMTLAKCGAMDDARRLYTTSPHRTVFSCTALMSGYVDTGQAGEALKLYYCMQREGMEPDSYTLVSLLKAFECMHDLEGGRHVHAYACKKGVMSIPHVCNSLIGMYGKCGAFAEAEHLFCLQCRCNIISWSIMLLVYCEQGQAGKALQCYRQMHEEGLNPDQFAYVFALQACGIIADNEQYISMGGYVSSSTSLQVIQALHADALWKGYISGVFVGTAFLTAYGKCGTLLQAEHMFDMLTERNLVSWNALISAYMDNGCEEKALLLYVKMQKECVEPEQTTFLLVFQACGNLADKDVASMLMGSSTKAASLQILQALHADFCIAEQSGSAVAATALLRSYVKCGAISEADDIFNTLLHPDLVSCNAMLTSYVEHGQGGKAITLYLQMEEQQMAMDDATIITILPACSEAGNMEICMHLHFGAVSTNFDHDLVVATTLIHAYGNCSMVVDAQACFDGIFEPDAASWNACIADHAGEQDFAAAFCIFEDAKLASTRPDEVAFTSILAVCMHAGLVAESMEYFESMGTDFGLTPDWQHQSILVDVFARAGDFKKIENILEGAQVQQDMKIWLFLLGACRTHNNIELAKQVFECALGLQPKQATAYVLMSNIYATRELQVDG